MAREQRGRPADAGWTCSKPAVLCYSEEFDRSEDFSETNAPVSLSARGSSFLTGLVPRTEPNPFTQVMAPGSVLVLASVKVP